MKKILIIGAGGSLAKSVIEEAKQLDNTSLTLFVRSKNRLSKSDAGAAPFLKAMLWITIV